MMDDERPAERTVVQRLTTDVSLTGESPVMKTPSHGVSCDEDSVTRCLLTYHMSGVLSGSIARSLFPSGPADGRPVRFRV
ncbi:hypothetical protein EYF80_056016 [Liparis tanakae]|uniref:Uncharacterized protein n=1 Tax=Liparis tanakae TaxID=230148 RepID=A0A4Z2EZ67_9TELE|nr:hypothetical protein EYF80_056016 [Liparis tanakae]